MVLLSVLCGSVRWYERCQTPHSLTLSLTLTSTHSLPYSHFLPPTLIRTPCRSHSFFAMHLNPSQQCFHLVSVSTTMSYEHTSLLCNTGSLSQFIAFAPSPTVTLNGIHLTDMHRTCATVTSLLALPAHADSKGW